MKKLVSLLLVFVMLLGVLCSCNDTDKDVNIPSDDANTPSNEDKPSDETNKPDDEDKPDNEDDLIVPIEDMRPIFSSYIGDTAYISKATDLFIFESDVQNYFYILKWEQTFPVADDFNAEAYYRSCGYVGENIAWIFEYEGEKANDTGATSFVITMTKIHRDTKLQEKSTLSLPISLDNKFSGIFCNMLNENDGFLFLYKYEYENSGNTQIMLGSIAKTTDGGNTWTVLERNETWPSISEKEKLIVSHFFDENNAIIVPRTSSGGNANDVYVTSDGGRTWDFARIPYSEYDPDLIGADNRYLELFNFEYSNQKYILTFRLNVGWGEGTDGELVSFLSTDLKNWIYVQ